MTKTSDYIRLLRIHTSAETQGLMLIGYLAAGGSNLGLAALWLVYGVVAHAWGFLQNNLLDLKADRLDPEKKHFPLVSGAISLRRAYYLDMVLLVGQPVLGVFLIGSVFNHPLAWTFLFLSIVFGTLYNVYSKRSLTGPAWISLAYLCLGPVSYFAVTSAISPVILLIMAYVFFTIWWQISYSGYLKDIGSDKVNLLRRLGMGTAYSIVQDGFRLERNMIRVVPSRASGVYGAVMRLPTLFIGVALLALGGYNHWAVSLRTLPLIGYILVSVLIAWFAHELIELPGIWDHHKAVMRMAVVEVLVYYALVVALTGFIGLSWVLFLIVYPTAWFFLFNKVMWGTLVTPRV